MAGTGDGDEDGRDRMTRMEVNVTADSHRGRHGYEGATLVLPASIHEIKDALQRTHVPQRTGVCA